MRACTSPNSLANFDDVSRRPHGHWLDYLSRWPVRQEDYCAMPVTPCLLRPLDDCRGRAEFENGRLAAPFIAVLPGARWPQHPLTRSKPAALFRETQPAQSIADRLPDIGATGMGSYKAGDRKAGLQFEPPLGGNFSLLNAAEP